MGKRSWLLAAFLAAGCSVATKPMQVPDSGSGSETGSDTKADTSVKVGEGDADSDADTGTESQTDSVTMTDSETTTETSTETNTETSSESETTSETDSTTDTQTYVDTGTETSTETSSDTNTGTESDTDTGTGPAVCGNGILEAGEQCDDGNTDNCDDCVSCKFAKCGDGYVQAGVEECDDGNTITEACAYGQTSCTVCDSSCNLVAGVMNYCGDGVKDLVEQCDDGNTVNGDGCENDCTLPRCGNGVVDQGEQCDDGNTVSSDGCDGCNISTLCTGSDVWYDTSTGLCWMKSITLDSVSYSGAIGDCNNATVGGYDDWNLPTVNDLRSLVYDFYSGEEYPPGGITCCFDVSDHYGTKTGGPCGITDTCMATTCDNHTTQYAGTCQSCSDGGDGPNNGCYLNPALDCRNDGGGTWDIENHAYNTCWSSGVATDNPTKCIVVRYWSGSVGFVSCAQVSTPFIVRCVRGTSL